MECFFVPTTAKEAGARAMALSAAANPVKAVATSLPLRRALDDFAAHLLFAILSPIQNASWEKMARIGHFQ
jgi:hypothetical protein